MSTLSNAVTSCSTELQNDFAIVSRWFERRNNASFDFTMQYVLDTCITIINNMNQQGLHPNIFNNSQSLFVGDYFNIMYDIFHDLLNNVLNYQKEKGQRFEKLKHGGLLTAVLILMRKIIFCI